LTKLWSPSPGQVERSGCVDSWWVDVSSTQEEDDPNIQQVDSEYIVTHIEWLHPDSASPSSTKFHCPQGMPPVHSHPPHTCRDHDFAKTCAKGGWEAYECFPSRADILFLIGSGAPFGMIQCGPTQWRFFFPADDPDLQWEGKPDLSILKEFLDTKPKQTH
jgi:hypothetical protein